MADESLILLINEVRNKTLRLLDGVTPAEAAFAPPGLVNTITWHAGHCLIVNEAMGIAASSGKPPVFPEGWLEKFKGGSEPAKVSEWPALADIVAKLKDQQQRLVALVTPMSEPDLARVVNPQRGRTARYMILHGLHDEAGHQGEIWLLRKLWSKKAS